MGTALTVSQVANLLNVNERTVYRMAQRGELPAFKVAGIWRFLDSDIVAWVEQQKQAVADRVRKQDKGRNSESR
ncbi:helix-turn-helix domain-containing protein [Burkholderia cepacia]|nr:helix-turn-helix domain-containing protein [Burkholderia cepacia]